MLGMACRTPIWCSCCDLCHRSCLFMHESCMNLTCLSYAGHARLLLLSIEPYGLQQRANANQKQAGVSSARLVQCKRLQKHESTEAPGVESEVSSTELFRWQRCYCFCLLADRLVDQTLTGVTVAFQERLRDVPSPLKHTHACVFLMGVFHGVQGDFGGWACLER